MQNEKEFLKGERSFKDLHKNREKWKAADLTKCWVLNTQWKE